MPLWLVGASPHVRPMADPLCSASMCGLVPGSWSPGTCLTVQGRFALLAVAPSFAYGREGLVHSGLEVRAAATHRATVVGRCLPTR